MEMAYNPSHHIFNTGGLMSPPNRTGNPKATEVFGTMDRHKILSVVVAVVESNTDPANGGRVQISLPWLGSTLWARVASPPGSASSGKYQVGDEVVVAFEFGDIRMPVVLGRLGT
jgi:uncharacterized protein involved in type VI secretion and phage assembly